MADQRIEVEQYLDLTKFIDAVEEGAQLKAGQIAEAYAKGFVQVDTGTLRNSIRWNGKNSVDVIGAGADYAAVQEYGRPGMVEDGPRIVGLGYTPFMRPAAAATAQALNQNRGNILKKVIDAAFRFARIR